MGPRTFETSPRLVVDAFSDPIFIRRFWPKDIMRKLVVSEFVTLDGVMEDPGGSEKTKHGGWSFKIKSSPDQLKFKFDELLASDGLLLGRVTYQGFAQA